MEKYVIVKEDAYGHITLDVMPSVEAMTQAQVLAGELGLIADEDGYYDGNGNNIWLYPLGDGAVVIDGLFFDLDRLVSIRGSSISINGKEACSLVWTETPKFISPLDDGSGETSTGFVVPLDTWADMLSLFEKGGKMVILSEEKMRELFA
jgi:hypothetical protein